MDHETLRKHLQDSRVEAVIHGPPRNKKQEAIQNANPNLLPALRRYIMVGQEPGDFLKCVLRDRFAESMARANEDTVRVVKSLALYLYNDAPQNCWGGLEVCREWKRKGGIIGSSSRADAVMQWGDRI